MSEETNDELPGEAQQETPEAPSAGGRKGAPAARGRKPAPKRGGTGRPRAPRIVDIEADGDAIPSGLQGALAKIVKAEQQSRSKGQAKDALKTLTAAVGQLSPEALRDLLADESFQDLFEKASLADVDAKPGAPVYDANGRHIGFVPYSYENFCEMYPMHTWYVQRDDVIDVNGVAVRVYEGTTVTAPKVFFDMQMESIQAERYAASGGRDFILNSKKFAADGIDHAVGAWNKMSNEELVRQYGVER